MMMRTGSLLGLLLVGIALAGADTHTKSTTTANKINIVVKTVAKEVTNLEVEATATILQVKQAFASANAAPADHPLPLLVFKGKQLAEDTTTLADHRIGEGATLVAVVRKPKQAKGAAPKPEGAADPKTAQPSAQSSSAQPPKASSSSPPPSSKISLKVAYWPDDDAIAKQKPTTATLELTVPHGGHRMTVNDLFAAIKAQHPAMPPTAYSRLVFEGRLLQRIDPVSGLFSSSSSSTVPTVVAIADKIPSVAAGIKDEEARAQAELEKRGVPSMKTGFVIKSDAEVEAEVEKAVTDMRLEAQEYKQTLERILLRPYPVEIRSIQRITPLAATYEKDPEHEYSTASADDHLRFLIEQWIDDRSHIWWQLTDGELPWMPNPDMLKKIVWGEPLSETDHRQLQQEILEPVDDTLLQEHARRLFRLETYVKDAIEQGVLVIKRPDSSHIISRIIRPPQSNTSSSHLRGAGAKAVAPPLKMKGSASASDLQDLARGEGGSNNKKKSGGLGMKQRPSVDSHLDSLRDESKARKAMKKAASSSALSSLASKSNNKNGAESTSRKSDLDPAK